MGKPGKAVLNSSRNACRPAAGRGAWLEAVSFQPRISFPFRFWSLADNGVFSILAAIPSSIALCTGPVHGQQNCLMTGLRPAWRGSGHWWSAWRRILL
jgi:hypothetical protein